MGTANVDVLNASYDPRKKGTLAFAVALVACRAMDRWLERGPDDARPDLTLEILERWQRFIELNPAAFPPGSAGAIALGEQSIDSVLGTALSGPDPAMPGYALPAP